MNIIYADNAATMPMSQKALDTMTAYLKEGFGNPSALYSYGMDTKRDIEHARKDIAEIIGARNNEIFFTSGGTESDNWALMGGAALKKFKGRHIITTSAEHSAVYQSALWMAENGYEVTFLPVDSMGRISPEQLEAAIRPDTVLISVMLANNEIGTILPIKELSIVAKRHKILFHTDAVQAVGHIPVNVDDLGVDLLSMSAHKFGGPKGIGCLYARIPTLLPPLIHGGGQEKGRRSGTLNVPAIMSMAAALKDAVENMEEKNKKITALRNYVTKGILDNMNAEATGDPENRLPGLGSYVFPGCIGGLIVAELNKFGICAGSGSACSAGSREPSRILLAAGYSKKIAGSALRLSLTEKNTIEEMDTILQVLPLVLLKAKGIKLP